METFLFVPRLTAERRQLAVRQMKAHIDDDPRFESFRLTVDHTLAAQAEAVTLERRWRTDRDDSLSNAERARIVDAKLDRAWTALHDLCVNALGAFEPGSGPEVAARTLIEQLFPRGPAAVTNLPYVDQHAALKSLVERSRTQLDLVRAVQTLSVGVFLDRIDDLNEVYGDSLGKQERISYDEVLIADRRGWLALTELVARILGAFPSTEGPDEAARRTLLGPLREQEAAMADHRHYAGEDG